jgi:5-methylcytosine-specific restriction endonuclease McrA
VGKRPPVKRRPGTRHRRAGRAAVKAFTEYARVTLSAREGAALLDAVARSHSVSWRIPPEHLVWDALERFAADHLSEDEMSRYRDALETRKASGTPLVDPRRVAAVAFAQSPGASPRNAERAVPFRWQPPRSANEWIDRRIRQAGAIATKAHRENQRTPRYRELRNQALAHAGYKCESCAAKGRLQLHHRHYETLGSERLEDVMVLCDTCHLRETKRQAALKRARWRPLRVRRPKRRVRRIF